MKPNTTLSIAIMSGKGGVGKTNIALNLGFCLFKGQHPLLLMDCDLGLANLDVLLGIAPEKNLQDVLDADMDPNDVAVTLEKGGFDFLPAASGVPELVDMDADLRSLLLRKLHPIFRRYNYLFLDLGAGINPTVLSFAAMSRIRVIVVTPEPTSLTDGYALIKVLATQHNVTDFQIIVNQVESKSEEKQTFDTLRAACQRFLNIDVELLGGIRHDKTVHEAVRRQTPLMKMAPNSPAGKDIFAIAQKLHHLRASMLERIADEPILANFQDAGSE
ncbi:MAG: MinD/ParA family protein [Desulfovibrionaceae bacterium]